MRSQRILVLMHETLVPPENLQGYSPQQIEEFRTEYDVVKQLKASGNEVQCLGLGDDLAALRNAITEWKPYVAFNLLEEFQGIVSYDQHVVAYLELMRQPYTGCNPRGLMISRDKALSKQILAYHRVLTPRFAVLPKGKHFAVPRKLQFPLFVKSVSDDASLGISQASLVNDVARLKERVEFIHEQTGSAALVEEFIAGRELYVGITGNERLITYPVWELSFGTSASEQHGFATRRMKGDARYRDKHGIDSHAASGLSASFDAYISKLSKRIYRALSLSGYARLDFRLTADNKLYVLEANANPCLSADEDFAVSAAAMGDDYATLLKQIIRFGNGYKVAWRQ